MSTQKMITFVVACLAILIASTGISKEKKLFLPDSDLVGSHIDSYLKMSGCKSSQKNNIYPINVSFDLEGGVVVGLVFVYEEGVDFDLIRVCIDERFSEFFVDDLDRNDVDTKIWRNDRDRFVLSLTSTDVGEKQVIYRSFL